MTRIIFSVGLALGLLSFTDTAIGDYVIWDESIDGDLSNFFESPTELWGHASEDNFLFASVGGDPDPNVGDGYDVFYAFVGFGNWTHFFLESYDMVPGNLDSQLDIYEADYTEPRLVYSTTISEADIGINLVNQIDFPHGLLVVVSEFDVEGQGYSFGIRYWVPEPSSAFVLAVTMLGLIGIRKR